MVSPRGSPSLASLVLAAFLAAQWGGWTHRSKHAAGGSARQDAVCLQDPGSPHYCRSVAPPQPHADCALCLAGTTPQATPIGIVPAVRDVASEHSRAPLDARGASFLLSFVHASRGPPVV